MSRADTPRGSKTIRSQQEAIGQAYRRNLELEQRPDRPYLDPTWCLTATTVPGLTATANGALTHQWLVSGSALTLVDLTATGASDQSVAITDNGTTVAEVTIGTGQVVGRTPVAGYIFSPGHLVQFVGLSMLDAVCVQAWFLGSGGGSLLFDAGHGVIG